LLSLKIVAASRRKLQKSFDEKNWGKGDVLRLLLPHITHIWTWWSSFCFNDDSQSYGHWTFCECWFCDYKKSSSIIYVRMLIFNWIFMQPLLIHYLMWRCGFVLYCFLVFMNRDGRSIAIQLDNMRRFFIVTTCVGRISWGFIFVLIWIQSKEEIKINKIDCKIKIRIL
jgi:hypothetical protein